MIEKVFNYEAGDSFKTVSAIDECRIGAFQTIVDTINYNIKIKYGCLSWDTCADISCSDPKNFKNI